MTNSSLHSIARKIVLVTLGILFSVGRVDAGNVRLVWDPNFGPAYPNLGFSGEGNLEYASSCVANVGGPFSITAPDIPGCDTNTVYFTDVTLSLYDVSTPNIVTPIAFVPPLLQGLSNPITDIFVGPAVPNVIASVDTVIFGPRAAPAVGGFGPGSVWLQFVTTFDSDCDVDCAPPVTDAFMFVAGDGPDECPTGEGTVSCIRSGAARVTIPEPGSIALLLAALGAAGMLGRRRRSSLAA